MELHNGCDWLISRKHNVLKIHPSCELVSFIRLTVFCLSIYTLMEPQCYLLNIITLRNIQSLASIILGIKLKANTAAFILLMGPYTLHFSQAASSCPGLFCIWVSVPASSWAYNTFFFFFLKIISARSLGFHSRCHLQEAFPLSSRLG